MGESTTVRVARGSASVAAVLVAAVLLTGCSGLARAAGAAPDGAAPTVAVADGSGATAAPAPSAPIASADPVAPATPTPTAVDGRTKVTPFVTSAVLAGGTLQVGALVPTLVEDDGTCTLTATDGSATLTATAGGVAAGSSTGCAPLTLTDVPAGTWQVRVRYESGSAVGTSAEKPVTAG